MSSSEQPPSSSVDDSTIEKWIRNKMKDDCFSSYANAFNDEMVERIVNTVKDNDVISSTESNMEDLVTILGDLVHKYSWSVTVTCRSLSKPLIWVGYTLWKKTSNPYKRCISLCIIALCNQHISQMIALRDRDVIQTIMNQLVNSPLDDSQLKKLYACLDAATDEERAELWDYIDCLFDNCNGALEMTGE